MTRQIIAGFLLFAGLAVFIGLGTWQVQRLAWKQGVIAEIEAVIGGAPTAIPDSPDPQADRYRPVRVAGSFEPGELLVLVSSRDLGAGFRVIAPFVTDAGRRIMIDRGFVRTEAREASRSLGAAEIEGNLHWPDDRNSSTPEDDVAGNWWYARDVAKMARELGTEPVLVIARTSPDPTILPMPVSTEAIPNRHLEYAVTWFLLAATWVVMTGFALWRIRRRTQ
ncbi:SURF1 family protein [Sinisalibacter lacisalsi]|uniref:SURF1-like protein n=1 Tax=Sinisalibacter lacisalsi TaxID=1526570 RepID=A0ABQ1QS43_9RHOB|nr:SURF1 family protein [Sinisalibacter lacisalsi]GGD43312.1 SURF1-like protein [Sinisalibacter lacisalsi]